MDTITNHGFTSKQSDILQEGCDATSVQQHSLLLELPAELRVKIYEKVILLREPIATKPKSWVKEPNLVAVYQQIRSEALSLFYGRNTFATSLCMLARDDSGLAYVNWLCKIGRTRASMVKTLQLRWGRAVPTEPRIVSMSTRNFCKALLDTGVKLDTLVLTTETEFGALQRNASLAMLEAIKKRMRR